MQEVTMTFKMQGSAPDQPLSVFHLGQSFYLAGNRCGLNIETGPGVTQSLTQPSVVNYCFSIELFCKALIHAAGQKPRKTHNLESLFNATPETAQKTVTNTYHQAVPEPQLQALLKETAMYFEKVRYDYESDVFVYQEYPLATLAKVLYVYTSGQLTSAPTASPGESG